MRIILKQAFQLMLSLVFMEKNPLTCLVTFGDVSYRFGLWIWLINIKALGVIGLQQGIWYSLTLCLDLKKKLE